MMPVYNGIDSLPLALSSLLHQTYTNWKCYIVNDGSTDGTREYLDSLTDDRFVVIHFFKNKGRAAARQAALEAAEEKYLAFLDADDFYHPEKLKIQVNYLENNDSVSFVSCRMGSYNEQYDLVMVRKKKQMKDPVKYKKGEKFIPSRAGSLVRIKEIKYSYNLSLNYAEDTDFFINNFDEKYYFIMDDILYYYSEFVSVTKFKILTSEFYSILSSSKKFTENPVRKSKNIIINVLRIIIKSALYPFVDVRFYLSKRGVDPLECDKSEYKKVLRQLGSSKNKNLIEEIN